MVIHLRRVRLALVILLAARLGASAQNLGLGAPSDGQRLVVSFAPERLARSLHEPILLHFSAKNTFRVPITVDLGWNRVGNFRVSVVKPDGSTIHPVQLRRGGISRSATVSLEPGDTYQQDLLLNEWCQFEELGDYRLEIRLAGPIREESGTALDGPLPQEIRLSVGPRDPAVLAKTCNDLMQKGISSDAETALTAAKALSYVVDLAAVPYLGQLTRSGPFAAVERGIAIEGLNRIAAVHGSGAVVSHLKPGDRGLAPQITGQMSTPMD